MAKDSEALKKHYLECAKNTVLEEINGYNDSSSVNGFKLDGKTVWLKLEERQALKIALDAYERLGETTMTKMWDGVEYTMPITAYRDMLAKVEQYASECQNTTERHLAAVKELTTVEKVCDYDYTTGYPDMIDFGDISSAEDDGEKTDTDNV